MEPLKHGSGILLLAWSMLLILRVTLPRAAASSAVRRATWTLRADELAMEPPWTPTAAAALWERPLKVPTGALAHGVQR
eukprot:1815047-Alexandrium_andersonii.AAC.1